MNVSKDFSFQGVFSRPNIDQSPMMDSKFTKRKTPTFCIICFYQREPKYQKKGSKKRKPNQPILNRFFSAGK